MRRNDIRTEYFEWLVNLVCGEQYSEDISYRRLLSCLHDIEFTYSISRDQNRAEDGIDLRWRYVCDRDFPDYRRTLMQLDGPCSVLEMMIALSIRCEENIMDDPGIGDRTSQWFWGMIINLGLGAMLDDRFDERYVRERIDILLRRKYEPDGTGGLFTIENCRRDLRNIEIWYQLCWYLDSIV